jgi:hypothetical protein
LQLAYKTTRIERNQRTIRKARNELLRMGFRSLAMVAEPHARLGERPIMINTQNPIERALRIILIVGFIAVLGVEAWLILQALTQLH